MCFIYLFFAKFCQENIQLLYVLNLKYEEHALVQIKWWYMLQEQFKIMEGGEETWRENSETKPEIQETERSNIAEGGTWLGKMEPERHGQGLRNAGKEQI